jgi:hypothetical protein
MTEIDDATAPSTEAEIKEHQAALIRQMVAVDALPEVVAHVHSRVRPRIYMIRDIILHILDNQAKDHRRWW